MSESGFNYAVSRAAGHARDVEQAIEFVVRNYYVDQLGLSEALCAARIVAERERSVPKGVLEDLASWNWSVTNRRVLDLGSGQGGLVLELLDRGAEAYGVEPSREYAELARRRLVEAGHDPAVIQEAAGESIPFEDNFFDYVISLQVLEHVPRPEAIVSELFRVLKPGGQCHLRFENYLVSFREPHYRLPWLPLLPKGLGVLYLRFLGRNPEFLRRYIHYTTYPTVWRACASVGFVNRATERDFVKLKQYGGWGGPRRIAAGFLNLLPQHLAHAAIRSLRHLQQCQKLNAALTLIKPGSA
jgi:SAM-dependent methyltransferase